MSRERVCHGMKTGDSEPKLRALHKACAASASHVRGAAAGPRPGALGVSGRAALASGDRPGQDAGAAEAHSSRFRDPALRRGGNKS